MTLKNNQGKLLERNDQSETVVIAALQNRINGSILQDTKCGTS
jgi:hypothetical protein